MADALPMISCLTATLDRLPALKECIRCYLDQTYPSRELVIASEGRPWYRRAIRDFLATLGRDDVRLVELDGEDFTLGKVRNALLSEARGEIFCQWDDDDLCHPRRLEVQADFMRQRGARASVMNDQLQYFWETREMIWVDWARGPFEGFLRAIPGTVMAYRDAVPRYPEEGPAARQGEDSVFLQAVYDRMPVAELRGAGYLYVYTYHGTNTFGEDHHRTAARDRVAELEPTPELRARLTPFLSYYRLAMPYSVRVTSEEVFFTYSGGSP